MARSRRWHAGPAARRWRQARSPARHGLDFLQGNVKRYSGGYNSAENDALIEKTLTSGNLSYMYSWQNFISSQLPQEWQPDPSARPSAVSLNLAGQVSLTADRPARRRGRCG